MMKYKGFIGTVEYVEDEKILFGRVINSSDEITFQSRSAGDIENEFIESIEAYLELCEKKGRKPDKTFSGKFLVRISPEKHIRAIAAARKLNLSLNAFMEKALDDELKLIGH